jgi:hypothetical protein
MTPSKQWLRQLDEVKRDLHASRVGKLLEPGVEESEALVEATQFNPVIDEAEFHLAAARGPAVGFGSGHEL